MNRDLQAEIERDPLLRTATEWFLELRESNVAAERVAQWHSWLAAEKAHREAFTHVERLWTLPRQLPTIPWPTDAAVAADTYDGAEDISSWRAHPGRTRPRGLTPHRSTRYRWIPRWIPGRPLAASLTVILIVALAWSAYGTWPRPGAWLRGGESLVVETTAGERRTITLSDGSTVNASGLTRLSATLSDDARSIILEQGEAFFDVAKDATRPFTVKAGDTAVTAVGTAFNVRRARERVVVAVAEGRVRVEATDPHPATGAALDTVSARRAIRTAQLNAGQQLALDPDEMEPRIAAIAVNSVGGWRAGTLQYLNEPLEIVVADLARYSARPIHIADAKVGALRVTGTVFETNIDGWLESLESTFPVQVTQRSDGAVELETRRR